MEEAKPTATSEPPALQPSQQSLQPVQAKSKKKKSKKEKRFKLTRFDKDLAQMVRNGITNVPEILEKMAVDPEDFNKRVSVLVKKGFFVFDSQTRSTLKLGWHGYNFFTPKPKRTENKQPKAQAQENEREKAREEIDSLLKPLIEEKSEEKREERRGEERGEEKEKQVFHPPSPSVPPVQILPSPQSAEDLAELLKKGAAHQPPKTSLFVERQKQKSFSSQSQPAEKQAQESRRKWAPQELSSADEKPLPSAKDADTGQALILEGK